MASSDLYDPSNFPPASRLAQIEGLAFSQRFSSMILLRRRAKENPFGGCRDPWIIREAFLANRPHLREAVSNLHTFALVQNFLNALNGFEEFALAGPLLLPVFNGCCSSKKCPIHSFYKELSEISLTLF